MVRKVTAISQKLGLTDLDDFELISGVIGAGLGVFFGVSTSILTIYFLLSHF